MSKEVDEEMILSINDVAWVFDITRQAVQNRIKAGTLKQPFTVRYIRNKLKEEEKRIEADLKRIGEGYKRLDKFD